MKKTTIIIVACFPTYECGGIGYRPFCGHAQNGLVRFWFSA